MASAPSPYLVQPAGPAADYFTITPGTGSTQPSMRGIYCGSSGNVVVLSNTGATVTFPVALGVTLAISPQYITSGTTATPINGLV